MSGTFGATVNTNLPSGFKTSLSYDADNAYLNLALAFVAPPTSGLSHNQSNVGNALINFFNSNGGIPLVYGGLSAAGLTQASGETATGTQQTTFNAMTQFMGANDRSFRRQPRRSGFLLKPMHPHLPRRVSLPTPEHAYQRSGSCRRFNPSSSAGACGLPASAARRPPTAMLRLGSNSTTSQLYGTAVGADYRFSPYTIAGFALAGGGTSFSVDNGGCGRSDLFQAGAYLLHSVGSAYISAALAYGWQDVTTNRAVMSPASQLHARFNTNAFSGRIEAGNRWVMPWMDGIGLTPYAAAQFMTLDLPAYAESALIGSNAFALGYGASTVTDTRTELGLRSDKSFVVRIRS